MGINAKPFSWAEKITRITFLGRPSYFNAIDLTKAFDVLTNSVKKLFSISGSSSDVVVTITNLSESSAAGTTTRTFDYEHTSGSLYANGVKFTIPAGSYSFSTTFPDPNTSSIPYTLPPASYLILTSAVETKTFADSPALCGISSTEYPTLVPSVSVEKYGAEGIAFVDDPSAEPNLVAILATLAPVVRPDGTVELELFYNAGAPLGLNVTGVNYTPSSLQINGTLREEVNFNQRNYLNDKTGFAKLFEANRLRGTQSFSQAATIGTINTDLVLTPPSDGNVLVNTSAITLKGISSVGDGTEFNLVCKSAITFVINSPDADATGLRILNPVLSNATTYSYPTRVPSSDPNYGIPDGLGGTGTVTFTVGEIIRLIQLNVQGVSAWVIVDTPFEVRAKLNNILSSWTSIAVPNLKSYYDGGSGNVWSAALYEVDAANSYFKYKIVGKTVHIDFKVKTNWNTGGSPANTLSNDSLSIGFDLPIGIRPADEKTIIYYCDNSAKTAGSPSGMFSSILKTAPGVTNEPTIQFLFGMYKTVGSYTEATVLDMNAFMNFIYNTGSPSRNTANFNTTFHGQATYEIS